MPSITRRPKVDPTALYRCLDSHLSADGTYNEGLAYRGDDPGVRRNPHLFIPDAGLSDVEFTAAQASLRYATHVPTPADVPISSSGVPMTTLRPLTVDEAVVVLEAIPPSRVGVSDYRAPIAAGTVLAKSDPLVIAYPKKFRPATPADLPAA
jgi:hypothetical protein